MLFWAHRDKFYCSFHFQKWPVSADWNATKKRAEAKTKVSHDLSVAWLGSISAVFSSPVFDPPEKEERAHFPNIGWLSSLLHGLLSNLHTILLLL